MHVTLSFDGDAPADELFEELTSTPDLRGAEVRRLHEEPEAGTLGLLEVVEFVGQDVMLPMLVNAVYDYLKSRMLGTGAGRLEVTMTRTDLPGGERQVQVTAEGSEDAVAKIVEILAATP